VRHDSNPHPTRGFFGRRKGHRLRPAQARLLATLLPELTVDLERPAPPSLQILFPIPVDSVHLEIGFGSGEHLVREAQAHPRVGFIGCEPFVNGMAKALAAIDAFKLVNIRLHHGEAKPLLAWLPEASLSRIDLLYPDPWPKRRHWKRRLIQDESIPMLARVLRAGGLLRFATDWPDYAAWTLERFLRSPDFEWLAARADDWRRPWSGYVATRYERKARAQGRVPCYLTFRRR
jgi:tRNA (guanine-N7-)-methyltransferase